MALNVKQQSNPFSTGGGGVNFETRVQAAFAISLLTQSCVPCLSSDMRAKELKFQNKYEGVNTDDFVLVASDKSGNNSRLYAQIKHAVTISESTGTDENGSTFSEVINSAWSDFNSSSFDRENDCLALITGPLPKLDIANTLPILEWAKYSSNSSDFIKKSETKGFTSEAKLNKLKVFKAQLKNANEGIELTNDELWGFLRVFYIVSYDLDSAHSVVASLLCSHIQFYSNEIPSLVLAKVITSVQEFNQNAGVLTLGNVPDDLSVLFEVSSKVNFENDFLKLLDRGDHIYAGVSSSIKGFHVDRSEYAEKLSEAFDEDEFIFVTGARGVGKSGVVKDFVSTKRRDIPVFYLRAEDLDKSHLNDVFSSIGMSSTLGQIDSYFSLLPQKILVIESLEKVLELSQQNAFIDLLQFIKQQTGWTILATGRDYAYQQLAFNFLQPNGIKYNSINIEGFTKEQVKEVGDHAPEINNLISNESLVEMLKIPFFIEIAVRAINGGAQFKDGDTEFDFRRIVWSSVIAKEQDRKIGMPVKRKKTFIDIAIQRAKKMVFGISVDGFDPEVVSKLEEDHLIHRDPRALTISLPHDVLEDWALEEFIDAEYIKCSHNAADFLRAIGSEPAISRAFRLWLYRQLKYDQPIFDFVKNILRADEIDSFWKDETIAAILQHDSPETFLGLMKNDLLKDGCTLLIRFCFVLRIACQRPNPRFVSLLEKDRKSGILKSLFLFPFGNGWGALLNFIYEQRSNLSLSASNHIVEIIDTWCTIINIYEDFPEYSRVVGLLSIWLLEPLKDDYRRRNENYRKKILNALLKVSPTIEAEFDVLMERDVFISKTNPRRLGYVDELVGLALLGLNVPILCKYRPAFVIKLSMHEWLLEREEDDYGYDLEKTFGLDQARDFFPASGAKGPFAYLLQFHPRKALDFIIKLCNLTAKKYAESERASSTDDESLFSDELAVKAVDVCLNDGSLTEQYASSHLWKGFRGQSTLPYLLQCALMALENWLVEYISASNEESKIEWIYDYLLRNSNSVMITSVLSSVAVGFPSKVKKAAFPILNTADFYYLDLIRMTAEMGGSEPNWFGFDRDLLSKIYIEERRVAALRPWRKESLETLLTRLQFDSEIRESVLNIVDRLKIEASERNERSLKYLVHRVDTRDWETVEDNENNRVIFKSTSELSDELKQDQQQFNEKHAVDGSVSRLYVWSKKLFEEVQFKEENFSSYQDALKTAKDLLNTIQLNKTFNFSGMAIGAITTCASVCVRDVLDRLEESERQWCFKIVLDSIFMHADITDGSALYDKTDHYGSGACAFVLPKLFEIELDDEAKNTLKLAIATALTHVNSHVGVFAAKGVRKYLWERDFELASHFLNGAIEYAKLQKENIESRRFNYLQGKTRDEANEKWSRLVSKFRNDVIVGKLNPSIENISLKTHSSWFVHLPLIMIPIGSNDARQFELFHKIIHFAFDSEYEDYRREDDQKIQHDIIREIKDCLIEHVVFSRNYNFEPVKSLLVEGCSKVPGFIYSVKLSFDVAMEKIEDFDSVWSLWEILAVEAKKIALNYINDEYTGRKDDLNRLLRGLLYVDCPWQGHPSEEKVIEKGAGHLLSFFQTSANNSHVFEALASLIYYFHNVFFEKGIRILAENYRKIPKIISLQLNTTYYLEMSIGRYLQIENRGTLTRDMHNVCLDLLTGIVETGSARAYYLREGLVRSRRISV